MSVPRDLKVDDPRLRHRQDQRRLRARRPAPDGQDRQEAVRQARRAVQDQPHRQRQLRRLPQGRQLHRRRLRRHRPRLLQRQLGRRDFATIDVNPGYQKLKGQDALDYVRYRHGDNDLVRAARQQDFLRQLRNAAGARRLLDYRRRRQLARLFARYTDTDKDLRRKKDVFSLLKLVLFTGRKPVREVRFRVDLDRRPGLPDRLAGQARRDRQRVPQRPGVEEAAHHVARLRRRPQVGVRAQEQQPLLERARARDRAPRGRGPGDRRRPPREVPLLLPDAARQRLALRRHGAADLPHRGRARQEAPRLPPRGLQGRRRRVLRHPGHDLARAADPRRPVGDPQGQRPQARAALRRAPPAARRLADQARGLLGLQHAHRSR